MPQIEKTCVVCLTPFLVYPYRAMSAKTCSTACTGKLLRTKVPRNCRNCGKEFLINPSQIKAYKGAGKYCSQPCAYKGIIKETAGKPVRDKHGRTRRKADREWQQAVRIKDGYTCQRCGKVEKYIHTHHVAPRSRRPDLRHDLSNGKCLCNSCHSWVHEHPKEAINLGLLTGDSYELARKKSEGEAHGCARLTEQKVKAIRMRYAAGESPTALAIEFQVTREHIYSVAKSRTWKHI